MSPPEHSNHLERRLTKVEVGQAADRVTLKEHRQEIKEMRALMITPRDIRMMIAGILTICGALAGKVPWSEAIQFFKH